MDTGEGCSNFILWDKNNFSSDNALKLSEVPFQALLDDSIMKSNESVDTMMDISMFPTVFQQFVGTTLSSSSRNEIQKLFETFMTGLNNSLILDNQTYSQIEQVPYQPHSSIVLDASIPAMDFDNNHSETRVVADGKELLDLSKSVDHTFSNINTISNSSLEASLYEFEALFDSELLLDAVVVDFGFNDESLTIAKKSSNSS